MIDTVNESAYGIAVIGSVLYITGDYNNSGDQSPCYWSKPGASWQRTPLSQPSGSLSGSATVVVVDSGTLYITGGRQESYGGSRIACAWIGTARTDLDYKPGGISSNYSTATGIAVSNGTVYVAGNSTQDTNWTYPCYWTVQSGTMLRHDLPQGGDVYSAGRALGIVVSGTDLYVVGSDMIDSGDGFRPCYWKVDTNTSTVTQTLIPSTVYSGQWDSYISSVAVSGSTIYFAGVGSTMAIGADGTVYVAGSTKANSSSPYVPCYWAGTSRTDVDTTCDNYSGESMGVVLLP